jgi:hypothetical protein
MVGIDGKEPVAAASRTRTAVKACATPRRVVASAHACAPGQASHNELRQPTLEMEDQDGASSCYPARIAHHFVGKRIYTARTTLAA